ncbi:MAG TPA: acyl-CoA dehydrogenase family protein, partial [Polyangiales bacterium]
MELTRDQSERVSATYRFACEQLSPGARERERSRLFDRVLWQRAAEFGLTGLAIPEQFGGSGLDLLDTMLTIEALGRGCEDAGLVFSLCAHLFASAVPLWRSDPSPAQQALLRELASGRLICANGTTEPGAGSDVYALKTRAVRQGDVYVLDGSKCFITNAPLADLFLVYAATDPRRGYLGISAFLIPRDTPGLSVQEEDDKVGLCTSPWGSLYFQECIVDAQLRIGPEGAGAGLFRESMVWERACLFAYYVGAMERTLASCVEHARARSQFGRPIGSFQAIAHRIVDMKLRLEASRLLMYRVGELQRAGKPCEEASALSKIMISESAVQTG